MKTLLIVGPLPPPIGGSPLTLQSIVQELEGYPSIEMVVINTSPSRDPRNKMTGFRMEKLRRFISVVGEYIREINSSDAILVFANNLFAITIVPFLLLLARISQKPFYLKPVGGDLDLYLESLWKPFKYYLLYVLKISDGVLAQTQLLQKALIKSGLTNTFYLPGCRTISQKTHSTNRNQEYLRLIYLSHITRDKGPLILLEALQILADEDNGTVSCDFYGPIHDEIYEEFDQQLKMTSNACYSGVVKPGSGIDVIAAYDALVLPTYFACEGHPGVIIEAMHAGVPVVSTQHRAIPELITDGENGILIPVLDSHALAKAINQIKLDSTLRDRLGEANRRRGEEFRGRVVVENMLEIIFPF